MAEIITFNPEAVGDGYAVDSDAVLDGAKGRNYSRLVIIGETDDGDLYVASTSGVGEILILIELAKRFIVFGDGVD